MTLKHIEEAKSYIGVKEIAGGRHNQDIVNFHAATSYNAKDDETPWCASFVCYCLGKAGIAHTGSARSLSYLSWGDHVEFKDRKHGDVVVFDHKDGTGHVGFYIGDVSGTAIAVLGGNQDNKVGENVYQLSEVAAFRRVPETPIVVPEKTKITQSSTVATSIAIAGYSVYDIIDTLSFVGVNAPDTVDGAIAVLPPEIGGWVQSGLILIGALYIAYERIKKIMRFKI